MSEEPSLKDSIKRIEGALIKREEEEKTKEISFWSKWKFWQNVSKGQIKKNWVQIIYLSDNKNIKILKTPIDENVIMIDNIPHTVDVSDVFLHKGKPTIIQPSWSIKPLSLTQNMKETKDAGNTTLGWEYIMNYLKKTEIKSTKNMGAMIWIIVGLIALGAIYYFIKTGTGG